MDQANRKWKVWWVVGLSVLAGIFLYVGWTMSSRAPSAGVVAKPLLVVFPDGGELKVAGVSVGQAGH